MPIEFLRGVVGLIGVGCAHMFARTMVATRRGQIKLHRMYAWVFRTFLCLLAVWYPMRGVTDTVDMVVWGLSFVAFAFGYWDATREKKQEDLTHEMFPDE